MQVHKQDCKFIETEIGPVPVDWGVARLGSLACVRYGKAKPQAGGNVPVVGSGGIYGETEQPLVDLPTLVIGRKGSAGSVWLLEEPCWPADTTFYLEWKQPVNIGFLYGYVSLHPLSGEHAKTTLPSLQRADLENLLVPFPPLPEQRAIASVLRTVQQASATTEQVIAAARELKRSLMQHLFAYGPVAVGKAEQVALRDTEIGLVPEHWTVAPLGSFIRLQRGFDLPKRKRIEGSIPVVSSAGVSGCHCEPRVRGPGVVTGRYGSIGAVHYIEQDFWPLNTTLFVKEFGSCDPKFVYYFLQTLDLRSFNDKTSVPGVNRNDLHALQVALPTPGEQVEIARLLDIIDRKIAAEEAHKVSQEDLFKTLLHHLMTGRVRVPPAMLEEDS